MPALVLDASRDWTLRDCMEVIDANAPISIAPGTVRRMRESFEHFSKASSETDVYGVSTGLGPMVSTRVDRGHLIDQQYQLIFSHASGQGPHIAPRFARACVLARARSMSAGLSAVRPDLPELLVRFLNENVAPVIPRHGGVGASGDLVQLAHLGLGMIGRGQLLDAGAARRADQVFRERLATPPLELMFRDGLAICNGTSCMTGIAVANITDATALVSHAVDLAAALAAITETAPAAFGPVLNGAKRHRAQQDVARRITDRRSRFGPPLRLGGTRPLQEHYSIRCTPQIIGTILQTVRNAARVVEDEFNSVSDNPIFDPHSGAIEHGGNFHGEPVAVAMDQLKLAMAKLTMLLERQINFLVNDDVNKVLPAFLNRGTAGIDFGFQGAQFTAVSTTAHSQSLAFPMSLHSIPSNKDNQDIVSMGTDSAMMTAEVIDNAFSVMAILALAVDAALAISETRAPAGDAQPAFLAATSQNRIPASLEGPMSDALAEVACELRQLDRAAFDLLD